MTYFKTDNFCDILDEQLKYMTIEEWREINNRFSITNQLEEVRKMKIKEFLNKKRKRYYKKDQIKKKG